MIVDPNGRILVEALKEGDGVAIADLDALLVAPGVGRAGRLHNGIRLWEGPPCSLESPSTTAAGLTPSLAYAVA
jgi:hypothetical protein